MKLKTKILPWHDFKTLRDELQGYNQQELDKVDKTLYLATYHKLLKLHEQGFPLLLQEGDAFEFDSPPVNAYLLPPLDQNPQTPRWLLVFFVTEDEKSWVQLLTWQTDANRSIIQALANQPRQAIEACNHRLDQRPINLQFVPAPNASTIHLIFTHGELTLVASPSKGIIVTAWDEQIRNEPWIERYSTGSMEPAVKISRYGKKADQPWQDDVVTDINGVIFATKDPQMGRIRGADGILNTPEKNWVYLASNRGYVYRLDKNTPDEKPLKSDTLYDEILDVLVLPWPDKATVILATVRNSGVVYLLKDDGNQISILHWQHTGKHIWRLVGRGDNHILAIDERQTLLLLRLNPPDEIKAIHELATRQLVQLYQEELNHYLSTSLDFKHQELTQFYELGNLALEYFLLGLPLAQAWPLFENWCNKLNSCYKTLNPSQQRTLMDLHYQLINRVFNWLQSCCYKKNPALSDETKELVFAVLLKLLALDNAAPDTLWVLLFRKLDWLTLWTEKSSLQDKHPNSINVAKNKLTAMRADFAYGLNLIRPLITISSYRLTSQITHIADANDGQYAFIVSNRDLLLYQSNALGTDCENKLIFKHGINWQGRMQFVRTLPSKPNEAKRFLIGTLRGELRVLKWDRTNPTIITVEKTKDCPFAVISCLRLDKYNGYLLLGGRNFKGHACLYGLPASADMKELIPLWTDTKPGILSVLRINQDESRLWAINRDNGELLSWNINPHHKTTPRFVSNQPHWLNTVHKLHALQYSATQQLLVCGSDGGLTYALDANTGALRWVVNCVGNLRHIAYLRGKNSDDDVWLLCTDERSSLIVNNNGCVTGVLENAGPVSALTVLNNRLLLATMDGRFLVMGNPDKASPIDFNPSPQSGCGAYPVRGRANIHSAANLCAVLVFESEYTNESLIKIMALCLVAEFLENNNEITDDLEKTFLSFWEQQNLHKKIVFLYRLRNLWLNPKTPPNPTICGFSLRLIRTCWDNLLQNTPELNSPTHDEANLLCKLVSPLLDILDKLIHYRYETDTAKQLQLAITQRIWNTAHSDLSPHEIRVFSAIRLNKVLSVWQQLPQTHSDVQRLFAWCNQVATLAQITETEPLRLLLKQLFQAHLRLLAIDNPWQAWLIGLVIGTEPSKPFPKPLNALALANEQLIVSNQDWELLSDIFGDNKSWQAWLDNLQTILQMVRHTRQQQPHKAWAERAAWRRLREHIVVIGNERFTLAAQQALPALGWQTIENIWSEHIEQSLRELDQQVRQQPDDYLILATQDHWLDSKHLKLSLNFHNYFPAHLNLNKLSWQGLAINQAGLPKLLQADDHLSTLTLDLHSDTDNKLIGDLQLAFSDLELGQSFTVSYHVFIERNLSHFSSDPQWLGTWQRLEVLLIAYTDSKEPFYWLDGDVWSHEERSLLKDLVSHKFNVSVADHLWHPTQDLASTENIPLFSPDLALSAPASTQLEQLHALLLPWLGSQNHAYWALALWHHHHRLPDSIAAALTSVLPQPETVNTALTKLLGQTNKVADIMSVLGKLPQRALGAWCANEPFYALKPEEKALANRVYLPAASLLPMDIWKRLDLCVDVEVEDVAMLLNLSAETVQEQHQMRLGFYDAVPKLFQTTASNPNDIDPIAQKLLAKLGAGSVSYQAPAWCLTLAEPPQFLNWQDFDRVYLLPKVSSVTRADLRTLPKGLWLCLGESHAPSDLNGVAIGLTEQQTLALLHTEQPDEALQWLNRIAGTQLPINPALAFRAAFGLSNLISTQFLNRDLEMQTLRSLLDAADTPNNTGSAALIIGGRRMGKTCLRERILYDVRKQQPKRVCLSFNFEGKTELSQSEMFGIKLEFWFFKEMAALFKDQGQLFDYDWGSAYDENKDRRKKARERLEQHLTSIKNRTGHTVLFTFDETEHLVKADTQNAKYRYELFSLFRPLLQANKLCLIATSYPFGADMPYALNIASHNSDGPMYNTFAQKLTLSAWLPSQAWDYLHSRLAGFGVILPRYYRQELIDISRGVPWILQFFGQTLCETLLKLNSTTKIVSTQVWQITRQIVLKEIHKELRQSVECIAEIQDQLHNINVSTQPESLLSQGHLWTALTNLARAQPRPLLQAENLWPGCLGFYTAELEKELPHAKPAALKDSLIRLAATPILEGDANDGKHYVFANNLLPMWLQYSNGEH